MSLAVTLIDENTSGEIFNKRTLELVSERVTLRELITQRIREEVDRFNDKKKLEVFSGLVQPTDTEKTLNGFRLRKPRLVKFEEQLELALSAFKANGFFVLVDDRQVDDLDALLALRKNSTVSFVKLVPLVGG